MASFTGNLYNDQFYLIVAHSRRTITFTETLWRGFEPFDTGLWIVIFTVFGLVGVMLMWENQHQKGTSRYDIATSKLPIAFMKGLRGSMLGDVEIEKTTSGSWFVALFIAVNFLVIQSGYTAVVTTNLISQSSAQVRNLREAIDEGYRFCINEVMVPGLVAENPALGPLVAPSENGFALDQMDRGVCDAALIHEDAWKASRMFDQSTHCDTKIRLLETVSLMANACPVRSEIERAMSMAIRHDVEAGIYTLRRNDARRNFTYGMCKELPSVSTINQLTLNELGGPIYQLGIVAIVSLILTRVGRTLNNRANKLKEQLDVDNDGDVSTNEILQAVASSWKARMRRPSKDVEQEVRSSITNQVDRITQSLQIHDREGMKSLLVDVVEAMVSKNEVARSLDERRSTTRDVSKASVTQLFGV